VRGPWRQREIDEWLDAKDQRLARSMAGRFHLLGVPEGATVHEILSTPGICDVEHALRDVHSMDARPLVQRAYFEL